MLVECFKLFLQVVFLCCLLFELLPSRVVSGWEVVILVFVLVLLFWF